MKKINTTVTYRVSDGLYCNLKEVRHKGFPPDQRCRFCTNVGKKGFVCVMHNEPLAVEEGCLVRKCESCLTNMAHKSTSVPDQTYSIDPVELIKWAIKEYTKEYNKFLNEGYPVMLAARAAREAVLS